MGSLSIWHWLIVLVVVLVVFGGRGKVSNLMGDLAQGIKAFKKGMAEDETPSTSTNEPVKTIDHQAGAAGAQKTEAERSAESVRS